MWWRTSLRFFLQQIKIEHISGSVFWNVMKFVFIVFPSGSLPIGADHLVLHYIKLFQKTNPCFLHGFWRKVFLMLYFINWLNFIAWFSLLFEILGHMCIVIICCPYREVIHFEINFSLLIKPFFYITKRSRQKYKCNKCNI